MSRRRTLSAESLHHLEYYLKLQANPISLLLNAGTFYFSLNLIEKNASDQPTSNAVNVNCMINMNNVAFLSDFFTNYIIIYTIMPSSLRDRAP